MTLLEEIAFVIEDRGWKNCYLVEFVQTSVKNNELNEDLVDRKTLRKLKGMMYCRDCGYVKPIEKLCCWICSKCRLILGYIF